jgi:hypothetical protein
MLIQKVCEMWPVVGKGFVVVLGLFCAVSESRTMSSLLLRGLERAL